MTMKKPKLNKIKFSHNYAKLLFIDFHEPVQLIEVFQIRKETMSQAFIDYDTKYNCRTYYELTPGMKIVLIFRQRHHIFTTIRSCIPKKYINYIQLRGSLFDIVLEDKS